MSRCVLTLLASFLAATTAHAQNIRLISGEAVIRERMALHDNAELVVEARGFHNTLFATDSTEANGQQIPWPFTLDIPAGVKTDFSAAIRIDGTNRWVIAPAPIAAGEENVDLGQLMPSAFTPATFESAYMFGHTRLEARFQGEDAVIETDTQFYHLAPLISADGAKYQSDDGETVFWSKGKNALVTFDGKDLSECFGVLAEADKLWAEQGNEPGWRAIIANGRMALNINYGDDRLNLLLPEPEIVDGAYRYGSAPFKLVAVIRDGICQDDTSGRSFPKAVTLETAIETLQGCGGDTLSLLSGTEWMVGSINGNHRSDDGKPPDFTITDEGQIYGCNSFTGMLAIDGEGGLQTGPLATTRMACNGALMKDRGRTTWARGLLRMAGTTVRPVRSRRVDEISHPQDATEDLIERFHGFFVNGPAPARFTA
ncbi:META domain-containing protein [Martelella soudanensis]|uniref:META domain-containing protein n=1 Tax=unclassified Martelella TaxID=2629616 RepID=UPI0015DF2D4F|nr:MULTISPECIES: META domain-containing protein [unclassified Martelella]